MAFHFLSLGRPYESGRDLWAHIIHFPPRSSRRPFRRGRSLARFGRATDFEKKLRPDAVLAQGPRWGILRQSPIKFQQP
jgi:hypothetical protein